MEQPHFFRIYMQNTFFKSIVFLSCIFLSDSPANAFTISDLFSTNTNLNYGLVLSFSIDVSAQTVINNGDYYAMQKIVINTDTFQGNGFIDAPSINITTKKFDYTGTITCYGTCIIRADEPFDENMFKREGPGDFIIEIGEKNNNVQNHKHVAFSLQPIRNAIVLFPVRHPITTIIGVGACTAFFVLRYFNSSKSNTQNY